MVCNLNNEKV